MFLAILGGKTKMILGQIHVFGHFGWKKKLILVKFISLVTLGGKKKIDLSSKFMFLVILGEHH